MTPERHQQIKGLFLAAVELAPAEVAAFLASACGNDLDLREHVQSLLDHHRKETILEVRSEHETANRILKDIVSTEELDRDLGSTGDSLLKREVGTVIAERFRLIEMLGRGGMGVVYRAEDLEIGQIVALKFLNRKVAENSPAVEFVRREVRIARQITHPNVVRIFDLGAANGDTFISMEFVAGEDLASLVRRVGPLPSAKVLQLARELAAGLAAAHDAGILHRDLKPANVMIDGAGKVRILDFGIAVATSDQKAQKRLSGTPGFLAPELLTGGMPSVQSDLYAWGIVIYYAATGELPVSDPLANDNGLENRLRARNVNDVLATLVCSCLQNDPELRPGSVHELIAALDGRDPLEETVRAGRMPTGGLLAAASSWQPTARILDSLLGAGLAALILITLLAEQTLFLSRCGLVTSPEILRETAEQILVRLGHSVRSRAVLTGVELDTDCLQFVRDHAQQPQGWRKIASGEIAAVTFWYRHGDPRLPRPSLLGESDRDDLQTILPGSAVVRLDGRGKLLFLQAPPGQSTAGHEQHAVEWRELFELAELSWNDFRETKMLRAPPVFADTVGCWEGPADGNWMVQVVAASLNGSAVYFQVIEPWVAGKPNEQSATTRNQASRFAALHRLLWLVALGIAAGMAWRHVSQSYADWRGAWCVTATVLLLATVDWLCASRHSFVPAEEIASAVDWLKTIVFCGAVVGIAFLAVEPAARRWWPWSIITLRLLLDRQFQDRRIWADVLLGLVAGAGSVLLRQLCTLVNQLLGVAVSGLNEFDPSQDLLDHFGMRYKVAVFITAFLMAIVESLLVLALVVAFKRVMKSTIAAAVAVVVLLATVSILGRGILSPIDWIARGLLLSIATWLMLRFGLVSTVIALATYYSINNSPITLDWTKWYAPMGFFVVFVFLSAVVGCWRFTRPRYSLYPQNASRT